MKRTLFFVAIVACSVIPCSMVVAKNDGSWHDEPFVKRSQKKTPTDIDTEKIPELSELQKRSTMPWHKKPSAKYIAGGVLSAVVTVYAAMHYIDSETLVENVLNTSVDTNDTKGKDNDTSKDEEDILLPDAPNSPSDDDAILSLGEPQEDDNKRNIVEQIIAGTVVTAAGSIFVYAAWAFLDSVIRSSFPF